MWRGSMKKIVTVTKTTIVIRVSEILADILCSLSDEEILLKYQLTWKQLEKVYAKLFHGGYLSRDEMATRVALRSGRDASHIPFADFADTATIYECTICGYTSGRHFSECPRCRQVNLRRLRKRAPAAAPPRIPAYATGT